MKFYSLLLPGITGALFPVAAGNIAEIALNGGMTSPSPALERASTGSSGCKYVSDGKGSGVRATSLAPEPAPVIPACDPNCVTYTMPSQNRCAGQWAWEDCSRQGYAYKSQTRLRWKWVCPSQTFISCGNWGDNGTCCTAIGTDPSCAGNSGLLPCTGTPP